MTPRFVSSPQWSLLLLGCLTAVAAGAADLPAASDPRHSSAKELDQVVVSASPLRQSADTLAQPVDVLAGEALDAARATTLGETVGKLPGVQSSNFGPGVGRPIIRGLDGPRVGTLSGGLATQDVSSVSQDHGVTLEPFLADQIEVLKGPSTLLYGSGAIGGVVNVLDGRIAERPLDEAFGGRAELRTDSVNDGLTGMARLDASAAAGAVVLHADGLTRNQRDYSTPEGQQLNSFVDTRTGGVGASFVSDQGFLGLSISRYENSYGNPAEPGDLGAGERGVSIELTQDRYELKGGVELPSSFFTSLRGGLARTDYQHIEFEGDDIGTLFLNDATEGRMELVHRELAGWNGAFGLQASTRDFEAIGDEAFVPPSNTRAQGLFWIEQAGFNAVQLTLGARLDRVRTDAGALGERRFSPLSLSADSLWALNDQWAISLNVDMAERAPAEEELFANGPHVATASFEIGDPTLDVERAVQTELGLRYRGERFEAKAALYRNRFDGFITLFDSGGFADAEEGEDPLPVRQWIQRDATFRGYEIEGTATLLDAQQGRLQTRVFVDQVHATFAAGGSLPRIAPSRVGIDLRWESGDWNASIGAVRMARQDKVASNELPTDGYTLLDAQVAYHFDTANSAWELFVNGHNLTGRVGRVHTSFLRDRVILPGRNVSAGIRLFF